MKGFFAAFTKNTRAPLPLLPRCGACQLFTTCKTPKMPVNGKGNKGILIVGEAPGEQEDYQGIPFCGPTGQFLQERLEWLGIDMRNDCWIMNAAACRPPRNTLPPAAIDHCRPNVVNTIKELNPTVILLLGASPLKSVIGWLWKEDPGAMERWAGWRIPHQRLNTWICPTWHPSHIMREKDEGKKFEVMNLWFKRHLKAAMRLGERGKRPWPNGPPDYDRQIKVVMNVDAARGYLDAMRASGKPVAFDYETDRLKPDHPEARIVCCAVSDGEISVAYPWHGAAVAATKELLVSDVPKYGQNCKFESRWSMKHLGLRVRNWQWDSMLAAHVLDNRTGITSLEFQVMVYLGADSHKAEMAPYLKAKGGGNDRNRIHEVPLPKLLRYCAMDSLLEWQLGMKQRKLLGMG